MGRILLLFPLCCIGDELGRRSIHITDLLYVVWKVKFHSLQVMTSKEREIITDLSKCDFRQMYAFFVQQNEDRKNRTKEEKKQLKEQNEALIAEYGWCNIDGHKQRIGNFKIEPPGLFRGRGEHPKQGMLKKRIMPEDVIINCSKDSNIPKPPEGHRWKEVSR